MIPKDSVVPFRVKRQGHWRDISSKQGTNGRKLLACMQNASVDRVATKPILRLKILAYMQKRLKKGTFRAKKGHFDPKKEQTRDKSKRIH